MIMTDRETQLEIAAQYGVERPVHNDQTAGAGQEPPPDGDHVGEYQPQQKLLSDSDDANAQMLIDMHHDRFRRVADMRRWFVWDGTRWALDHEDRAIRGAARALARALPDTTREDKSFKRNSLSATGVSSAIRLAETDRRVSILAAELDAHPELINTPSGIVDLRTGKLGNHDPARLLTRVTAYRVDLEAPHPMWDKFLGETFPGESGPEMIAYIQRLAGLSLLGTVLDHVVPFSHGVGANGKGVLALVLQGLLGDADQGGYAISAPDGFLMAGRDGAHPTEIARLRGARLVVCSEQTSGKRFDEAKVKRLTGGDRLTGRFMRGDFFDFDPSHLVWVLSNHLPEVREGGPAFWRRVRLIPFGHVVPDDQQVSDLHELLIGAEGPAILGWMVHGAVDVLANGLADPQAVIKATGEYQTSEDSLASFVRDECLIGPNWWCRTADFRSRYEQHCREMGAEPLTAKSLTMRLTSEYPVIAAQASKGRRVYRGIDLTARDEEADQ
jgi:putative DNA primase/helicase